MPIYSIKCTECDEHDTFVSKIAERDTTPACHHCNHPTVRTLDAPMVTAMGLSDHAAIKSSIDGSMLYGRSDYYKHLQKHDVLPESEMKGEAAHQKKQIAKKDKEQRKKTISDTIAKLGA